MTVTWDTYIQCDYPGCYLKLTFSQEQAHGVFEKARQLAAKQGWTWSRATGDRCPKHKES